MSIRAGMGSSPTKARRARVGRRLPRSSARRSSFLFARAAAQSSGGSAATKPDACPVGMHRCPRRIRGSSFSYSSLTRSAREPLRDVFYNDIEMCRVVRTHWAVWASGPARGLGRRRSGTSDGDATGARDVGCLKSAQNYNFTLQSGIGLNPRLRAPTHHRANTRHVSCAVGDLGSWGLRARGRAVDAGAGRVPTWSHGAVVLAWFMDGGGTIASCRMAWRHHQRRSLSRRPADPPRRAAATLLLTGSRPYRPRLPSAMAFPRRRATRAESTGAPKGGT